MLVELINKLRNGYAIYHSSVCLKDIKFRIKVLDILWKENLIQGYTKANDGSITVFLRYFNGYPVCTQLFVVSRPRDRVYLSAVDLSRIALEDLGVLIVSTPKGIITAKRAIAKGEGGEVLAYVR